MPFLDELRWRGLIQQESDPQIGAWLNEGPRALYCGFDPTAATARCVDGTYWHSKSHVHACRGPGGVERWL